MGGNPLISLLSAVAPMMSATAQRMKRQAAKEIGKQSVKLHKQNTGRQSDK